MKKNSLNNKICSMEQLAKNVELLKKENLSVAQAHGTFDLLHLGHVKHLQAASEMADVLVVSLTADKYVNKGPGRPVFNQTLRAEMLSALEIVDWVCIVDAADAVDALKTIKPDYYVKGQDYQNPDGDLTGKIVAEQEAAEMSGGKLVFTDEMTFSSSYLINRHVNVFEPHVRQHLDELREKGGVSKLIKLLDNLSDLKVLFVGDAIIDEYQYVRPIGKPPKEDIIAARFQSTEAFAGGVFAAANHTASFCKEVGIISVLGARNSHEDFIRSQLKENVSFHPIYKQDAATTRKRRFVDPAYTRKLFEVYFIDDDPLIGDLSDELDQAIREKAKHFDVVIVTDFGHGMIGPSTIKTLGETAKFLAVNSQSNTANMGYNFITRYQKADYICIDAVEARLAFQEKHSPMVDVIVDQMVERIDCDRVIVTQGKHGCVTYQEDGIVHTIPALADKVVDTVGAGDAFLAITAPLVASGAEMHEVGFIGNLVGAIKVGIVGHRRSVEKVDVQKAITALLK